MGKIQENKAKLYDLESTVMGNKQLIYAERAFIEENRALILKNYAAAFMGNRQMANQNTDDIFRNRKAILNSLPSGSLVQQNFIGSKLNEATIDYMDHRSSMNGKVAAVSEKMARANALLIEVNDDIMAGNAEVVAFNSKHIEINTKLLSGELDEEATPEKNAERIEKNKTRIAEIAERAKANKEKADTVLESAKKNREHILSNAAKIYERRGEIEANHAKIAANAHKIAEKILAA